MLIELLGLRDAITARNTNTGDGHALDAARKRSVEAILRRRTIELTTHALPAAATKALTFCAVLEPIPRRTAALIGAPLDQR